MSSLPPKPELSRTANTWPETGDDRRPTGPGRASPDRSHYREDRDRDRDKDRDRDARDRERGGRSHYAHNGQRTPPPSRSSDNYTPSARDTYNARDYRDYDDARASYDRRKDWGRDRDREIDRDRDRGRAYYRGQSDHWRPGNDYSPGRSNPNRRGYAPRESDWRSREDYRRERDRDRGRSRDRDDPWLRDREHDRRPGTPPYRPAPLSPRRDHHHEPHSSPRRAQPPYPFRGRRSTSPRSAGSRSRRPSPLSRAGPEPTYTHQPRVAPRPPKSPSPRRRSPSPNQSIRPVPSPTRAVSERPSPKVARRELHGPDEPYEEDAPSGSNPVQAEDRPTETAAVLDSYMDVDVATETLTKGKDRSDGRDGEPHGKVEPGLPMCQQQLIPASETMPSNDIAVTQPFLPSIPRSEKKPRFSAAYDNEYNRLEGHRAHAAAECRRCLKASRRAFHELEMTTLDLRAAQHRRELAEAHRKKAHHGQLGIDAETVQ